MIFNTTSRQRGTGLAEVAAGAILLVFVVSFFFELYFLLMAFTLNDEIARNAARAAAMGPPSKLEQCQNRVVKEGQTPYQYASAVLESMRPNLPKQIELSQDIDVTETINPPIPEYPFGGRVCGSITVRTKILVHLGFMASLLKIPPVSLVNSKTYPYTWVQEYPEKEH